MRYIFLIIFFIISIQAYANEWDVDISQCTKVTVRFFYNNIENNINSPVDYYDINGNHVLRIYFNNNGQERNRAIQRYNEMNELIEYSNWDRSTGANQWNRWRHGIIEKIIEDDKIIFYKREKTYFSDYNLIGVTIYNINGNLISKMENIGSGSFSYWEYNDRNDVILSRYENARSDGIREERYFIEYDSHFNKICVKTYENENLISETINNFNENDLLLQSIRFNNLGNIQSKWVYSYDDRNNLIEIKFFDNNDNETLIKYYQYDIENRIIKEGERERDYERYWIYEYS
jgi:hypothetical protein